jgi:hypothetical protein
VRVPPCRTARWRRSKRSLPDCARGTSCEQDRNIRGGTVGHNELNGLASSLTGFLLAAVHSGYTRHPTWTITDHRVAELHASGIEHRHQPPADTLRTVIGPAAMARWSRAASAESPARTRPSRRFRSGRRVLRGPVAQDRQCRRIDVADLDDARVRRFAHAAIYRQSCTMHEIVFPDTGPARMAGLRRPPAWPPRALVLIAPERSTRGVTSSVRQQAVED